jgi:hypothetical protein
LFPSFEVTNSETAGDRTSENGLALTNLLVLTNFIRIEVMVDYEEKFLRYGKEAGFTNSLLEKYAVVDPEKKGGRSILWTDTRSRRKALSK